MQTKILFIWKSLIKGGGETALVRLLNKLADNNYNISLLLIEKGVDAALAQQIPSAVNIIFLSDIISQSPPQLLVWIANKFHKLKYAYHLFKAIAKTDILVLNNSVLLNIFAAGCNLLLRKKIIAWMHLDMSYYIKNYSYPMRRLYKFSLRRTSYIVCVSNFVQHALLKMLGLGMEHDSKRPPITTIYNLVDIQTHYQTQSVAATAAHRLVIMSLGRLVPEKGFDILIKAFHKIAKQIDGVLRIYGDGDKQTKEQLMALIVKLKLEQQVQLMGHLEQPLPAITNCDIFISSSFTEALALNVIEALSCNKAIIVTNTGAAETIDYGKYGELVDVGNVEQLASKILLLAKDSQLRQYYSSNAHLALKKFDNHKVAQQWHSVINKLSHK